MEECPIAVNIEWAWLARLVHVSLVVYCTCLRVNIGWSLLDDPCPIPDPELDTGLPGLETDPSSEVNNFLRCNLLNSSSMRAASLSAQE